MKAGRRMATMTYHMEDYLGSCVSRYLELAGPSARFKYVHTPFLPAETKGSDAGRPNSADGVMSLCTHCQTAQAVK